MDALQLLHTRNSAPRLRDPAPQGDDLDDILKAALRAPDHSWLRPWRFLTITGDAREKLGELFVGASQQRQQAAGEPTLDDAALAKLAAKPLRAPLIVVVVASVKEHPKVPEIEQLLSAGCAAHGIMLACHAKGFAGVWRTGANAFDKTVHRGLGLAPHEHLIGFLYLGTIAGSYKPLRELAVADYCQNWSG
ncbi:MAG: nitroreductase [Oceanicoccus sp.]|jgi:nitroreductase